MLPWFEVTLGGAPLSAEERRLIKAVKAQRHRSKADTFSIHFQDPRIVLVDDPRFTEGTKAILKMGFLDGGRFVWGHGIVKTVDCDFPDSGVPLVTLQCQDESILLSKTDKSRDPTEFDGMTDSEIVETIASEYGFGVSVETTDRPRDFKREPIQQAKMSDAALLTKLAERNGKKWGVEDGILWFRQHRVPPSERCDLTLDYRIGAKNVKKFKPKLRSSGPTAGRQVSAASIDPFKGETIVSRALGDVQALGADQMGNENAEASATFEAGKAGTASDSPPDPGSETRPREVRVRILEDATSSDDTQTVVVSSGSEKPPTEPPTVQTRGEGTSEGIPDNQADLDASVTSKQNAVANVLNAAVLLRIPMPDIRAGDWGVVRGVGNRFSGKYEIVQVNFEIADGSGTTMNLDLERKATGAGDEAHQEAAVPERPLELATEEGPQEGGAVANEEDRVFIPVNSTGETQVVRKAPVHENEGPRSKAAQDAIEQETGRHRDRNTP